MPLCPCGSGKNDLACCLPYLNGTCDAPTAETLMRARYTAFTRGNLDYIEKTSAPEVLKDFNRAEVEQFLSETTWDGLDVRTTALGGINDQTGEVEYVFKFTYQGEARFQHEKAFFVRENGAWIYKDSEIGPKAPPVHVARIGRNDPCTCGSGKKYKKCCGG